MFVCRLCMLVFLCCFGLSLSGCGPQSSLHLNEILAKSDISGQDDWIELHNSSTEPVSLTGLQLKDTNSTWTFPANTTIPAGGFLVVVCDDKNKDGSTNFKLAAEGETVTLQTQEGEIIDQVTYPALEPDTTWHRSSDGTGDWALSTTPTPAKSNQP